MSTNLAKPLRLRNDGGAQLQLERSGTARSLTVNASGNLELDGTFIPTALTTASATVTGGSINGTPIGGTTASTGAFTTLSASTSVTTSLVTQAGTLALSATGANVITASTNGVERLRVDSAGNVGIGTSSITNALGWSSVAQVGGANPALSLKNTSNVQWDISNFGGTFNIYNGSANRLRIDSSGNVGIGTTSPDAALKIERSYDTVYSTAGSSAWPIATTTPATIIGNISSTSSTGAFLGFAGRNTAGTNQLAYIGGVSQDTGNGLNIVFGQRTGAATYAERLRITSAGNVGIGTTALEEFARLDVRKTTASTLGMPLSVSISAPANEAVAAGSGAGISFGGAFNGSIATTYAAISGEKENATSGNPAGVLRFGVRRSTSAANLEAMRIDSAGYVRLSASSPGIQFGGDTAAANALNDYEEGTWTPNFASASGAFGALTFSTRVGYYTKIGNLVTVYGRTDCTTTTIGTATGELFISNLPFTSANVSGALVVAGSTNRPGGPGPDVVAASMLTNATRFSPLKENGGSVLVSDLTSGGRNDFAWTITYAVS